MLAADILDCSASCCQLADGPGIYGTRCVVARPDNCSSSMGPGAGELVASTLP